MYDIRYLVNTERLHVININTFSSGPTILTSIIPMTLYGHVGLQLVMVACIYCSITIVGFVTNVCIVLHVPCYISLHGHSEDIRECYS